MRKVALWLVGAVVLLVVIAIIAVQFIDEPLRRRMEADLNGTLQGYHVSIRKLDFHPVGFAIDLVDAVIVQEAHPDPPVAYLPKLHASVQWTQLLRGHLVADFLFDSPHFYLNLPQLEQEANDERPVEERGWQQAAEQIYPLKINLLRITGGDIWYIEQGPLRPMHVSGLDFRASNIRNVHSHARTYPSEIHARATLLDTASFKIDGRADFLAEPHVGVKAAFALRDLELAYLEPLLHHYDVDVRSGQMSASGKIEYAPTVARVDLKDVRVAGADIEYAKRRAEQATPGEAAGKAAKTITKEPAAVAKARRIRVERSTVAYRNETVDPPFRLFVSQLETTLTNFSNVTTADGDGAGTAAVRGKFMDSGATKVDATFHPRPSHTDFKLNLAIENTDVRTLNDLWRAYGGFDTKAGLFSFYSQMNVQNGNVDGYVKPIFVDLKIFDPGAESQGLGQKIYEGIVGGVATILRNQPRQQIATETSLSGPLDNPSTSVIDVLAGLVRNAFFKAILPGLKRQEGNGG